MDIFTSITLNYLPKAQILSRSLKKFHPDWKFHLIICDKLAGKNKDSRSMMKKTYFDRVTWVEELDIEDSLGWIFKHTVVELCTAVKGIYLQQLVREGAEKIVYIDPDIVLFNPLDNLEKLLDEHAIVFTPHLLQYTDDPQSIHDNEIAGTMRHGTFNLGFLAVNPSKKDGKKFAVWWGQRLYDHCYADYDHGLFTDQKWCDLVPSFFEDYFIIRDPGFNVASWNLDCRDVTFDRDGKLLVNNEYPLRFYHFTGYDSGAGINVINRLTSTGNNEVVKELWDWYMRQLLANGNDNWGLRTCYYNYFDNQREIKNEMRTLYRNDVVLQNKFINPFETKSNKGGFYTWWNQNYPQVYQKSKKNDIPSPINELKLQQAETYIQSLNNEKNSDSTVYVPLSSENLVGVDLPIKAIAFYLPQYHPIPENDAWWGKGFTEWANVTRAVPQFPGHYQPHLPDELGFYDLRVKTVQYRQVELAQQYGLHGFAFYYYWFAGKRLLEFPINQFLNSKDMDFPFCLIWANENWTRRWDGMENDILIQQVHSPEMDIKFIESLVPYLSDDRYIRINDRPVVIVYRADILPDPVNTVNRWREYCLKQKLGDPYLIAAQTFGFQDPRPLDFDAALQFPPHNQLYNARFQITNSVNISNPDFDGVVFSYPEVVKYKEAEPEDAPYRLYKTVFPNWDSEPRRPGKGIIFSQSSPQLYTRWLQAVCNWTIKNNPIEERIVFINAWNEWAEGAHLEPDRKYGYAYLQATRDALMSFRK